MAEAKRIDVVNQDSSHLIWDKLHKTDRQARTGQDG